MRRCRPSETDFNFINPQIFKQLRDGGRRKPVFANETTFEFLPSKDSLASEVGRFCSPRSEMGFFNPPIDRDLKLVATQPE